MIPHTRDYLDELMNVDTSKQERWIIALRLANEISDERADTYRREISREPERIAA
jgi:hypothetical protein